MQLNIQADIKAAEKALGSLKKQVPFAASLAMNKTAEQIRKVEQAAARTELENPTATTVRGIRYFRSNKRRLEAGVFVIPAIDKFLRYQEHGGTRAPRGRTEAVPVDIKLNRYGNIPGRRQGKLKKLANRPDTFSGVIGGVAGLWQRVGPRKRRLKLLVAYEPRTQYKPRWHFYQHAQRTTNRRWARNFERAIRLALATAR